MKKRRWRDRWMPAALVPPVGVVPPAGLVLPAVLVAALALLSLLPLRGAAQDSFRYRVPLDTPARSDFYRIVLLPEIVAHSQNDLADLRILGGDGRFVPYVLKKTVGDTAEYQPIPAPEMSQSDSGKWRSVLTLRWPESYRIDLLSLSIKSPTLYKREARIYCKASDDGWSLVTSVSIDPRDTLFRLSGVRTRGLRIEIDNADNPPLKTVGVAAKQAGLYLLTYLQAGTSYSLLTANPKVSAPQYDLGYFTDTLTRQPHAIGMGPARESLVLAGGPDAPLSKTAEKPADRGEFFLWSILTTVLLLLIYFSVKMVRVIGTKKGPHDRV